MATIKNHSDQKQLLLHTGAGDLGTVGRAATPAESPASPVWHLLGTSVHSRALQRREGKMKWELLLINLGLPSWSSWRLGKRHLTQHLSLYANESHCNYPWQGSKHSPATFTVCFLCITFLALFSTWRSQDTGWATFWSSQNEQWLPSDRAPGLSALLQRIGKTCLFLTEKNGRCIYLILITIGY